MPVDYELFLRGQHPDDVVLPVLQPGSGGVYDIEYRTVGLTDGKLRWLRAKGRALYSDGALHGYGAGHHQP